MSQTLQQLGGILLQAVPTIGLLLIVHFYLKWMFFKPVREVIEKRRLATEGARESAAQMVKMAAEKTATLEAALRKARDEIYQENEETRRVWIAEQSAKLEEARQQSRAMVHQAKLELDAEAATAKRGLESMAESLADEITRSMLGRKAS